jgi:hypothetical protein
MRTLDRERQSPFSFGLSAAPLFVTTALVILSIGGPLIHYQEKSAVAAMDAPEGSYSVLHEVEYSKWHEVREQMGKMLNSEF